MWKKKVQINVTFGKTHQRASQRSCAKLLAHACRKSFWNSESPPTSISAAKQKWQQPTWKRFSTGQLLRLKMFHHSKTMLCFCVDATMQCVVCLTWKKWTVCVCQSQSCNLKTSIQTEGKIQRRCMWYLWNSETQTKLQQCCPLCGKTSQVFVRSHFWGNPNGRKFGQATY